MSQYRSTRRADRALALSLIALVVLAVVVVTIIATHTREQAATDEGHTADSLNSEYAKGKHDAYSSAAQFIRGAFGDTDD